MRANIGVTILPRMMRDSAMPGVRVVPLSDPRAEHTVCLITRKKHQLSPLAALFPDILRSVLRSPISDLGLELQDSGERARL